MLCIYSIERTALFYQPYAGYFRVLTKFFYVCIWIHKRPNKTRIVSVNYNPYYIVYDLAKVLISVAKLLVTVYFYIGPESVWDVVAWVAGKVLVHAPRSVSNHWNGIVSSLGALMFLVYVRRCHTIFIY